jgi:hypothetical protein
MSDNILDIDSLGAALGRYHTPALETFATNLRRYAHFYGAFIAHSQSEHLRLREEIIAESSDIPEQDLSLLEARLQRRGEQRERLNSLGAGLDFGTEWSLVILATCVETYLQDVLALCACIDPRLMGDARPSATYEEVVTANSIENLAHEVRAKWARNWVDDGGPQRWIARLERMGVRGYSADLSFRLESLWGIRHLVVHRAGIVTAEFVRRHPSVQVHVGERIKIEGDLEPYVGKCIHFVSTTDRFFTTRYDIQPTTVAD